MNPLVSIIIPVYNGSNYMRDAIDSALAQTYKNIEILVINDGSKDNGSTRDIALSYGAKIRYFEKENGGVSTALNLGIKEMKGEYFSWLSHDDVYYPDKIQKQITSIDKSGVAEAIAYSGWDALVMPECRVIPFKGSLLWNALPDDILETGVLAPMLGFISGCSLLIPRKFLIDMGGFDEKYRCIQDYKLWFDMFRGRRLIYVRDRLIQSRFHVEQVTNTSPLVQQEGKYLFDYMVRNVEDSDVINTSINMYQLLSMYALCCFCNGEQEAALTALNRLLLVDEIAGIDELILEFKSKYKLDKGNVYLYCTGKNGASLLKWLSMMNVEIKGVADGAASLIGTSWNGFEVHGMKDMPRDARVIVTKSQPIEVIELLQKNGFDNVISFDELFEGLLFTPIPKRTVQEFLQERNGKEG